MRYLFLTAAAGIALAGAAAFAANPAPQATTRSGPPQVGTNTQQGNPGNGNGLQFRGGRGYCGGEVQCGFGRGMGRGMRLGPQDGSGPRRDGSCLRY